MQRAARRVRILLVVVVALVALGGCRARATVTVRMDGDQRGEVVARVALDRDAVDALVGLGDSLDDAVRLDDLVDGGWEVEPWSIDDETGTATLRLRKPFVGARQLESVLRELGGDLVVVDAALVRERSVLRSEDALRVTVDASQLAVRAADDPDLSARLTAAGYDVDAGDRALTTELTRALRVELRAEIPGAADRVTLQPGETVVLRAESSASHLGRLVWVVVGLGLVAVGVRVGLLATRRR